MVKEGEGAGVMESAMELINHADLATRMSAAGVLYNIARLLPKGEAIEVLQLASGLAHHLTVKTDGETCEKICVLMHVLGREQITWEGNKLHDPVVDDITAELQVCALCLPWPGSCTGTALPYRCSSPSNSIQRV